MNRVGVFHRTLIHGRHYRKERIQAKQKNKNAEETIGSMLECKCTPLQYSGGTISSDNILTQINPNLQK